MDALIDGKHLARVVTAGVVMLSLGLGLGGCKKPVASDDSEESAPASTAPAATPTPSKSVAAATPAATPAPTPQLAPPGVFYLLAAARAETNDGIVGLPPGTGVKLVRPGIYLTPAGEVPLDPSQLTNDMALARLARDKNKMTQAALQKAIAARTAAQATAAAQAAAANPGANSSAPAPTAQDEKTAARQEISRQLEANAQQTIELSATLNQMAVKYGSFDAAVRKSPQAFQLSQQLNSLRSQREALAEKMGQIR